MVEMFSTPEFYKPPPDDQLFSNTDYPNLNSREYLTRPYSITPASSRRFDECLAVNETGEAVLVANSYTDRIWHGHFYGFQTLDDVEAGESKSCFRLQCKSTLTHIQYVDPTMVNQLLVRHLVRYLTNQTCFSLYSFLSETRPARSSFGPPRQ